MATTAEQVGFSLPIVDPAIIQKLTARPDPIDYGTAALRIGLDALEYAGGQLDVDVIKREGDRILADVRAAITNHQTVLDSALSSYFDPASGRLPERLKALLETGGQSLNTLLAKCMTDAMNPLLLQLDSKYEGNIASRIGGSVKDVLEAQNKVILGQFSLDDPRSAVSRFLTDVAAQNGKLEASLTERVQVAVSQLSLDDETSAISRMQKLIGTAVGELSLDNEKSGLARLKRQIDEQARQALSFQEEVKTAIATLVAQRAESQRSTTHGLVFEDNVADMVAAHFANTGCSVSRTGNTTGTIKSCKVGDAVIVMSPDHACAGARIVVEAKESSSYTAISAAEEAIVARKNREASACVFVFSSRTAPKGQPRLTRSGQDVFVVWNSEDPETDAFLQAAISLAVALTVREAKARSAEAADFAKIDAATIELDREVKRLEEVATWTQTAINANTKILDAVRKTTENVTRASTTLREACAGLKGE